MSAPSSVRATSSARSKLRSGVPIEDRAFDALPSGADGILESVVGRNGMRRNQYTRYVGREVRIVEYFLQIIDEVGATKQCNAVELRSARAFEIDVLPPDGVTVLAKEVVCRHPRERRLAQIDVLGVV